MLGIGEHVDNTGKSEKDVHIVGKPSDDRRVGRNKAEDRLGKRHVNYFFLVVLCHHRG